MAQATIVEPGGSTSGLARTVRGIARVVVLCVAGLLLLTGAFKMQDRAAFAAIVQAQGLVTADIVPHVVWIVPWGEIAVGVLAVWAVLQQRWMFVRVGALLCSFVFLVFAGYAAALVIHPPPAPTPCGCLPGQEEITSWWPIVVRNGLVASLLACVGLLRV